LFHVSCFPYNLLLGFGYFKKNNHLSQQYWSLPISFVQGKTFTNQLNCKF